MEKAEVLEEPIWEAGKSNEEKIPDVDGVEDEIVE